MANVNKTHNVKLTYNYITNDEGLMDNVLDSVPHQMSGHDCDVLNAVTSANDSMTILEIRPPESLLRKDKEQRIE